MLIPAVGNLCALLYFKMCLLGWVSVWLCICLYLHPEGFAEWVCGPSCVRTRTGFLLCSLWTCCQYLQDVQVNGAPSWNRGEKKPELPSSSPFLLEVLQPLATFWIWTCFSSYRAVEEGLTYRFHAAWASVLQVLRTFFEACGKQCHPIMHKVRKQLWGWGHALQQVKKALPILHHNESV